MRGLKKMLGESLLKAGKKAFILSKLKKHNKEKKKRERKQ